MGIISIILKSLGESFKPKRFLPFFLLYFIFFLCVLIFSMPVLQILPLLLSLQFTETELTIMVVNLLALVIVFFITILVNLWFTGALIFDIYKDKGFDAGLKYSKKLYLQMILLGSVFFLLILASFLLDWFGIFVRIAVDWIFMFSLISIIVKKDNFETSLKRSYNIVKKDILGTFVFLVLTWLVAFLIIFFSIFLISASLSPLFLEMLDIVPPVAELETISVQRIIQITYMILRSYPAFVIASLIASIFFSIAYVFIYISRTYYFLQKKKRR